MPYPNSQVVDHKIHHNFHSKTRQPATANNMFYPNGSTLFRLDNNKVFENPNNMLLFLSVLLCSGHYFQLALWPNHHMMIWDKYLYRSRFLPTHHQSRAPCTMSPDISCNRFPLSICSGILSPHILDHCILFVHLFRYIALPKLKK